MFPHFGTCLVYRFRAGITTLVGRLLAQMWGVDLGGGCSFRGIPLLRRMPNSTIRLGQRCVFNSRSEYNMIGINHVCILSTLRDDAAINIGDDCGFSGTVIGCEKSITLGNRVRCGANTVITDTDWHTDDPRTSPPEAVVIEDDVWLGLNVVVLKGVTIGRGSIIGANSLVTRSIPAGVVAVGTPAKVIRLL
jgi:acetyltransferase-like isoleucine patch superfamily enzyme